MRLRDIGERKIIDRIWEIMGERQDYDDAVVYDIGDDYLLITTDYIGEGTHFLSDVSFRKVGEFFASVNLSDIAAMGGVPKYFMAAMFFPRDFYAQNLEEFILGMNAILKKYNVEYRGGDLKESEKAGAVGIAIGFVEKDKILRRKGAREGEKIFVTGKLGKQGASYILWKMGRADFEDVISIVPRVEEGKILAGKASACIDLSDGIIASAMQMQDVNNLGFHVNLLDLPLHPLALEVMEDYSIPLEKILNFGGEYELMYTSSTKIIGYEVGEVVRKKIDYGGYGYESFSKILDQT